MSLTPGMTLGAYRLVDVLGEGGMGVVWRAHDATLGRDVAIKVLPDALARDAERLARFEREAKLLAALSHPGIAAIYGLHQEGELRYLAMELADGENLAQRIEHGPIQQAEALRIALAVAEALESAHERGIVHRDLKPANIMIGGDPGASDTRAGRVKLLDFGLAKAFEGEGPGGSSPNLSQSPTITAAMTSAHVILGTAAYMSPEQARGQVADRRADVWSFGVVLYEMLAGHQLFAGETVSDTLASVLKTGIDWDALPGDLPPRVRTLLQRCLDRDRNRRLRDIGEARIALDDELRSAPDAHLDAALKSGVISVSAGAGTAATRGGRGWLPLAAAVLAGAALMFGAVRVLAPPQTSDEPLRKLSVGLAGDELAARMPSISPTGEAVACLTPTHIIVRELNALETRRFPIEGNVEDLFWSPDGKSLAYIQRSRLYRVDALSGQQQTVCEGTFTAGSGGFWKDDGTILFTQADDKGLFEVSERGGDPHPVFATDSTSEGDFHDPFSLPGGRGVIFVPHRRQAPFEAIELWAGGERKELVRLEGQALSDPVYSPSGHILFRRTPTNAGIWAVPFSLAKLEVTGEPFLVAPRGSDPSVANDGTLVYQSGASTASTLHLVWSDAEGREVADAGPVAFGPGYMLPALAPGGQRACASVFDAENPDLWVFDIARGTKTRLTFGTGREEFPVWSASGSDVFYHVRPEGQQGLSLIRIMRMTADGTGAPDTLAIGIIPAVSPDGRFILYSKVSGSDWDIAYQPLDGESSQEVTLVKAPGIQVDARVADGGEYVAYVSDESGENEIYLTRFPSGQGRWQISVGGGLWPRWNSHGDRLYYVKGDDVMAVDITLGASPTLGTPRTLFSRAPVSIPMIAGWSPGLDVSGDGERFLFFRSAQTASAQREMLVVQNWYSEFEAKK